MKDKFIHNSKDHGHRSPSKLVPILKKLFNPKSVIDIGCGTGNFLKEFKNQGVKDVLGIDGDWVNKDMLYSNLIESEFKSVDLERSIELNRKFELAISFEVAEHLKVESAETFVKSIVKASDVVVFSAAIPKQGGQNHLNEQWSSYWIEKFENEGFKVFDIIRPIIWEIKDLSWWYKQNTFVFIKESQIKNYSVLLESHSPNTIQNIIHPQLFTAKVELLENFLSGNQSIKTILSSLFKAISRKIGLK